MTPLWPTINAFLNLGAAACLLTGYFCIRRGKRDAHKRWMLAAFSCSVVFLASYLGYHFTVGSVRFQGQGLIRGVYLAILLSHTILAAAVAPLALVTLRYGLGSRFESHKKVARFTFPVWVYVSITGVVVYLMLYRM